MTIILLSLITPSLSIVPEQKCFNEKTDNSTWGFDKSSIIFPYGGSYDPTGYKIDYGAKLQVLGSGVGYDKNMVPYERKLVYVGEDLKGRRLYYVPKESSVPCTEKYFCSKGQTKVRKCKKCKVYGMIISDTWKCNSIFRQAKVDKFNLEEVCIEHDADLTAADNSVFRRFVTGDNFDFDEVSGGFVAVQPKLGECPDDYPKLICFPTEQNEEDSSSTIKANFFVYENNVFTDKGVLPSGIIDREGEFEEINKRFRVYSPNPVKIEGKDYYIVTQSLRWVRSSYLSDCDKIKPLAPTDNIPNSSISGYLNSSLVFIVVVLGYMLF